MGKRITTSLCLLAISLVGLYYSPIGFVFSIRHTVIGLLSGGGIWVLCYLCIRYKAEIKTKRSKQNHTLSELKHQNDESKRSILYLFVLYADTIFEELLFRSYLFAFTQKYLPLALSVSINVILFVLTHLNRGRIVQLSTSAVVYCLLVVYTGNILTSLIAHLTYNTIVYMTKKWKTGKYQLK